jgi:hypothetical protein
VCYVSLGVHIKDSIGSLIKFYIAKMIVRATKNRRLDI